MLNVSAPEPSVDVVPPVTGMTAEEEPVQPWDHRPQRKSLDDVAEPPRKGFRLPTAACFGISLLLGVVALALGRAGAWLPLVTVFGVAAVVTFGLSTLTAAWRSLRGLVDLVRFVYQGRSADVGITTADMIGNLLMAAFGMWVAMLATFGFARGRQLRRRGAVLLPDVRRDPRWGMVPLALDGAEPPAGMADQWRENGKTEHASVAAFARLTLDLMALGAPPSLIRATNEDALDEIRHTELCFSLAAALDGQRIGPAPFPQAQRVSPLPRRRSLALAKLAVDSLVDGALHEGVSARVIAKLSRRCAVPAVRAVLKEIAADEGRHAAHGWAVTRWCLEEGGAAVALALAGAVRALPEHVRSRLPEPAANGGWEHWGIHGHALEAAEYSAARAHVVRRVHAMISSPSTAAA
jgi:hypothetical protein